MSSQKSTHVSEAKKKIVKGLSDLIKKKRTILIASIKDLPASQFQEIGKKLRGKAIIKVPKKNLIFRAIDSSGNEAVKKLKQQIKNSVAILFSDLDCFELASELIENKSPAKARTGQITPEDIEVQAGPTDLVPGPAISELGAVGLKIQIEKGKIHIKEPKIIAKKDEKISRDVADIMNKLDIRPFSIGFIPLSAFDTKEGKLYLDIKIDKEGTLEELKNAYSKALGFAVEIGHPSEDTIKFLIGKAGAHAKSLEKISETKVPEDNKEINKDESEKKEEEKSEENKEVNDTSSDKPDDKDVLDNNSNQSSEPVSEQNEQETKTPETKTDGGER